MDTFSVIMFVAVGLATAHIAHKVNEGNIAWPLALALGLAWALAGGLAAAAADVRFYGVLGHMIIALGCATLCFLIWRQIRA